MTSKLDINEDLSKLLPQLTDEEREGLEADILKNGCLSPLIAWDGTLVDGHHRHAICRKHNIPFQTREMNFETLEDACHWAWKHHKNRRNMSPFVLAETALRLEPKIAAEAKQRQRQSLGRGKKGLQNSANLKPMDTRRKLAEEVGVSHDTITKAKVIAEQATPEVKERLRRGQTTINKVYTDIVRKEKEQLRESRRNENRRQVERTVELQRMAAGDSRFATITIDPPWDWGDEGDCDQMERARPTYGTMPLEKLLDLPVAKLADEDCHLYLWITNRSLPKGFRLLDRWGFRYITCLTWCKPSFGMGNYFRGSTEQVLFGVKGSQPLKRKNVGTWFAAPRGPLGHSSKPPEFYDLVESCSPGPYLEMFARSQRKDWSNWGAESSVA